MERARAAGTAVVHVQHCGPAGAVDEPGAPGCEIHPALAPLPGEGVVQKRTPGVFHETAPREELERRGARRLALAGLQTEYCMDTTCRRAFSLGYSVTLAADGHNTWPAADLSAA